jgi:aspartate kinase
MKILKFGGTSVGSAARMKSVADLINDGEPKIVVLSAMSGTTNSLVELGNYLGKKNFDAALELIGKLKERYLPVIDELFNTPDYKQKGKDIINYHLDFLKSLQGEYTPKEEKIILAQGELISTTLFQKHLEERGIRSALLPALNFMRIDKDEEPDSYYIKENLQRELANYPDVDLFITQGFICKNATGEIDNLKRGGSDYTASLLGPAVGASEIQIWTDIDGFHNNDPRFVPNTHPIAVLSFDEAAELAYFGAKILHPSTILPAKVANIPVCLKNTMDPDAFGTLITGKSDNSGIKAVAAKDNITAVKIKSGRMLLAYGFIRKVFEVFEKYRTPIDMITTSEVAISITIDNTLNLSRITDELIQYGTVEIDENQSIVCVVGDFAADKSGAALKIIQALKEVPLRMISYGGSDHNISILINSEDKQKALLSLHKGLF